MIQYAIFHILSLVSVVSKQPLKDYFLRMKITNLSGKKILLVPGDNDPASGMPINANVIALITKDVPVVEPNPPSLQFAVVDAETRKQFLLINGSQLVTLRPVPNKNVMPINLIIGNPSKLQLLRFTCIPSNSNIVTKNSYSTNHGIDPNFRKYFVFITDLLRFS